MNEQQKNALDLAIKQMDKAFGKGTLIRLGDKPVVEMEAISTGSLGLQVDGLNDDLDDLTEDQADLDTRMEAQESLLRAKFLAADSIIAGIKNMELFLTQQFEAFAAAAKT